MKSTSKIESQIRLHLKQGDIVKKAEDKNPENGLYESTVCYQRALALMWKIKDFSLIEPYLNSKRNKIKSKNNIIEMNNYSPKLDFNTTETAYFVDQKHNMMLHVNFNWDKGGDLGKGDSVGRTFEAYYVYKDKRFLDAIMNCWLNVPKKNGYYYQGYRFPTHDDDDMSRDHLFNTVIALIASGASKNEIKKFVTHVKWKISSKHNQTLDLWLWMRAMSGIWWAKLLSPVIEITLMSFNVLWQKMLYKIAPFQKEMSQTEFMEFRHYKKTKWEETIASMLYPSYTMTQYAWRLNYMKNTLSTRILKSLLLKIVNKHNYVVRMLLDDPNPPTREEVYSYKSMMGGRWDGILNPEINDRDLHIITTEQYPNYDKLISANVLDVDLVRCIYENKQKK